MQAFIKELLALLAYILRFFLGKRKPPDQHCVCPPALRKPDPFIYDQYYLMGLGFPVTWDNPDIYLFEGSTLVDPHDLKANTTYTVVARIWNNSTDVPVVNLKVIFSYLSFGMGVQSHPIGSTTTDLNVKGLPGCPAFAYAPWTTPATLGHYCIQVLLEPPDDSNWQNNLGQRNTDVAQAASPAVFTFRVGNHVGLTRRYVRFSVDTYTIPPLRPCRDASGGPPRTRAATVAAPLPQGWSVTLNPNELQLVQGEEQDVEALITPPSGFSGTLAFNVTGVDQNGPVGGITLLVEVP
ncbi:MAG: hypothetical protein JO078_06290 [Candidatus Eremiobacteraeota bacterium]|nr:hypothetical protein [Bryobacterales bacterium]MBV9699714.1 hypothetical protein [Candidatus Eremiobacteraeota bacterium]